MSMNTISKRVLVCLCVFLGNAVVWAESPKVLRLLKPDEYAKILEAMPDTAVATPKKPRQMLVFWRCEGFYHRSIPVVNEALRLMGQKTKAFTVTMVTDDYSVFTPERLAMFDIICLNNTTNLKFDPEKTPDRCRALMDFVRSGKGLVGVHAAADNFNQWPEAMEMMGNRFTGHPWGGGGTWAIKLDEPDHPLLAPFKGKGFKINDEIYRTDAPLYSRDKFRVLMSLDMNDPTTRNVRDFRPGDEDVGISWIREVGRGRLFYCSLGHNNHLFWNPAILEHYLRGIQFAAGDFEVPVNVPAGR
jgi:type 1 glutamine amidotransferase